MEAVIAKLLLSRVNGLKNLAVLTCSEAVPMRHRVRFIMGQNFGSRHHHVWFLLHSFLQQVIPCQGGSLHRAQGSLGMLLPCENRYEFVHLRDKHDWPWVFPEESHPLLFIEATSKMVIRIAPNGIWNLVAFLD